jgi:predicted transposase YbfD/YdcC
VKAVPLLDLQACVVTTDALNSQKNIAQKVQERGGDYVLALKENHRHLFEDVRDYFAWCHKQPQGLTRLCDDDAATQKWGHGRREVRRCFMPGHYARGVARGAPTVEGALLRGDGGARAHRAAARRGGRRRFTDPTATRHFYLSSLRPEATRLLQAIRAHWGIENSLHWVFGCPCMVCVGGQVGSDKVRVPLLRQRSSSGRMAFGEDQCRIRRDHAPQNLATLRKLALNLLRQDTTAKSGLKARRRAAGWDNDYLLRILAGP